MDLARACADKLEVSDRRQLPALEDVEEQAEEAYSELLDTLQEDEVFGAVDPERQEAILEEIEQALPESKHHLLVELADQQTRQVWLLQEAAYHVGLAIGMRLAGARRDED
jgi:Mg/Co/Ni transporter MgtE